MDDSPYYTIPNGFTSRLESDDSAVVRAEEHDGYVRVLLDDSVNPRTHTFQPWVNVTARYEGSQMVDVVPSKWWEAAKDNDPRDAGQSTFSQY